MKAAEWIDRVKIAKGFESDYRVSKELGLTRQAISEYRNKSVTLNDATAIKVAEALKIDPSQILADQALERAKTEPEKRAWAGVLERLGGMAAAIIFMVGGTSLPSPADAAPVSKNSSQLYIM